MANGGKKTDSRLFGALVEKMKADKKFELAVYAVLIMIGVLIFVFSSCDGLSLSNGGGATDNGTVYQSDDVEGRLEDILSSIDGAGKVKVMIVRADDGTICGAIVTAEGAADIAVRERLQNAVKTVLGIEINQVEIFKMESNNAEG
jgi:hypothetical protein